MRKGKAAGEDHISIKLHKTAGSRFSGELLDLFNIAYNTDVLPKDWQNLNYMPDMEKGDKRNCGISEGLHCCHMRGNCTSKFSIALLLLKALLENGSRDGSQERAQ